MFSEKYNEYRGTSDNLQSKRFNITFSSSMNNTIRKPEDELRGSSSGSVRLILVLRIEFRRWLRAK